MTQEVAYRFIEALAALEQREQIDPILDTFSEACDLANSGSPETHQGKQGAREYWHKYRSNFRDIRSNICNIITGDNSIALEWTAHAIDRSGKELKYNGVSILDTRDTAIIRFRAYFDTKPFAEKIPPQQAQSTVKTNLTASASGA
jgi:ketosteroid isomerase-like protein